MIFACDGADENDSTNACMFTLCCVVLCCIVIVLLDMAMAWRARDPHERIAYAHEAIKANEKYMLDLFV